MQRAARSAHFTLGQITRRIWMERRGHVDSVADHGLGVAHAGLPLPTRTCTTVEGG